MSQIRRLLLVANWKHALGEFMLIVAGVLVALAANAWWEGQKDRERERIYLTQLLNDTRENERRLEEVIRSDSLGREAQGRLVHALDAPTPLPSSDTLAVWIIAGQYNRVVAPVMGTYTTLFQTGEIRLIQDDSLRLQLVRLSSDFDREVELLSSFMEMGRQANRVYYGKFPFMWRIYEGSGLDVRVRADNFDFEPFRVDPEVRASIVASQIANKNRLVIHRDLLDQTRALRHALQRQVSSGLSPE